MLFTKIIFDLFIGISQFQQVEGINHGVSEQVLSSASISGDFTCCDGSDKKTVWLIKVLLLGENFSTYYHPVM